MIRHASVYDQPMPSDEAGARVLIMRMWPRGIRRDRIDVWLKDAAPSTELLKSYSHDQMPWAQFERRYRDEILEDRPHVLKAILDLELEHGHVTLLCHERIPPKQHCHRLVLVELLRQHAESTARS
jgi:uncharacterized protein YeaO (DUF488 family)